jgi:glycosyltransferase involved in cell wall biosynthesis
MCAYNVEEFIERAVTSILVQTYENWELIISNDASTDNTLEVIQRFLPDPRIKLLNHDANVGYVKNKNRAFGYAKGDLFTQLDADDTCPPDRLEKQVNVFLRMPEIKICGTNYRQIDLLDKPREAKQYSGDVLITTVQEIYPFWFPGLMFRPCLLQEFGLFSEYFNGIYGDDNYWTLRVNRKYPIYFVNDVLYNYRINPNSLTNVLDNPRKLIVSELITELIQQQRTKGTDWIESGETGKMKGFEESLLSNDSLMAEKYRLWAAKAIDKKDLKQAKILLEKSLKLQGNNGDIFKTMFYYLRRKIFN